VGDKHASNPEEGFDVKDRPHTDAPLPETMDVDAAFRRARREIWLSRVTAVVVIAVLALWAVRGEDVSPPAARYACGIALIVIALGLAVLMAMRAGRFRMLAERAYLIELHQATNRARQQVFRDHLSGLYSRWFFYERLTEELERCGRYGRLASVAYLCFPDWKGLALDTQAYLIEQVGYLLQNDLRSSDVATRWGPGQFVWYLPETDVPGAMVVVRRLAEAVQAAKAIMGAAQFPGDGTTPDELLRVAQTRAQHGEAAA
jgi:diguanylate cyclase (GGDEF)-like protein